MDTNSPTLPSRDMQAFQELLRSSKHIIAVAGAGLSAASGIPTFRGAGGMWRKYDATSLATPEAFGDNPSRVWQFYHYRREKALKAQPNAAHLALATFSVTSMRNTIAPDSSFALITQNVDGLSKRAWDEVVAKAGPDAPESDKSATLLEMHGRLFDVVCTSQKCKHKVLDFSSPICPALGGTEDTVERGEMETDIPLDQLPRCSKCGALARPGVVWFGEMPVHMKKINTLVKRADLCLVVGTSSTVYPAAGYARQVQAHGGKVAIFNLERSEGDKRGDFLFLGPCETTLPEALTLTSKPA